MDEAKLAVRDRDGTETVVYEPFPHVNCAICDAAEQAGTYDPRKATQRAYHASTIPNLLALGTRGTGKSLQLRMDFHLRCLLIPNFHALIVRRTMPELRRSHLVFIDYEMKLLGGEYLSTFSLAKYTNGSTLTLAHCETEKDVMNFLSAQYGAIGFDELSTFTLAQFLQISSAARAPVDAQYTAVVRASSNPLGIGSGWMYDWFVDKKVRSEDFPDYIAEEYAMLFSTLQENPHLDRQKYAARLGNLPAHVRKAWLLGERVIEGQYFEDFMPSKTLTVATSTVRSDEHAGQSIVTIPWHVIESIPTLNGQPILNYPWVNIYRCLDWGFFPDPAVCIWIAVLAKRIAIAFKEKTWRRTLAAEVAADMKRESRGMHVPETFCLPLDAPVWMGDYSFKPLSEVKVGDEVVSGPTRGHKLQRRVGHRTRQKYTKVWKDQHRGKVSRSLQRATVTAVHRTRAEVIRLTFASGRVAYCTLDHKWLSGSVFQERYIHPNVGSQLVHVVDDPGPPSDPMIAAWLGGIYDGEGCRELISQSPSHNFDLYKVIMERLEAIGFETGLAHNGVRWRGGLQGALKFVTQVPSIRYRKQWADYFILRSHYRTPDRITAIEFCGVHDVGCLTTTTGNFIAYGYITANCDPTMFIKHGETAYSIGEIMEQNGIPLTQSINRRDLLGYAVHEYLNTVIDNRPQLQIVRGSGAYGEYGCNELIRTLPQIRMDPHDPTKMAEGDDHWVVALAYFCAGSAVPSQAPETTQIPFWMMPKRRLYR